MTPTTLTLRVSVRDSGLGIPQEKLETIFDAFVRAHESRQQVSGAKVRPIEGTGLGLAIVARLIHMQNGTLEVSSREGEGSCFTFTLPYKVSNMAALRGVEGSVETNVTAPLQQKESENAPQVGHQLRILAAEV